MVGAELGQDFQGAPPARLGLLGIERGLGTGRSGAWGFGRVELNAADIEILLEAIDLEEIGELEGADVSASLADFALEIADDALKIRLVEARVEELIPEPFSIKAQAHALAGEPAI